VATVVVAKWTGDLDMARMQSQLDNETDADADAPEQVIDAIEHHMPVRDTR
jgi:aerobic C4-dicarboxylate transport protein